MPRDGQCRVPPEHLPTEDQVRQADQPYYVLGAYDDDIPDALGMVFLQRLELPLTVDSEKADRRIMLPDLASVHRWAATEFHQYEIGCL